MLPTRALPDLRSLDLLVSVARLGSLGKAAREHGISQPAASMRVQQLERRLGFAIVDRSQTGSTLTAEGAVVVDWATALLDAAAGFADSVAALRSDASTKVAVAASLTVAEYLVPMWLVSLRQAHPDLSIALSVGNSHEVAERVTSGAADVGFVEGPGVPEGLTARVIGHDRLVVVVAPGHPWARRRRPVTADELAATPLVQREAGSGTRETLERALRDVAAPAPPMLELSSTTAIKSTVMTGAAPAVLSELAVYEDVAAHRLVEVQVAGLDLVRPLRAVWPRGRRLLGPARDLMSVVGRATRR